MKRVALILCFIGVAGILAISAWEKQPYIDEMTIAVIAH